MLKSNSGLMPKADIYADKSALILHWLIMEGQFRKQFHLREVSAEVGVSLGQTQKIFQVLIAKGYLKVSGLRTGKAYTMVRSEKLIREWRDSYRLLDKKRSYTFSTGLLSRKKIFEALEKSKLSKDVVLALHSATQNHGRSNTNLKGTELYLLDPSKLSALETLLQLEPQERGYDVLVIEPFYKGILHAANHSKFGLWQKKAQTGLVASPPLLTYLDLYQYPLRGRETAEYLQKTELKRFFDREKDG